ncbi:MAG: GNAT family N-acetyltransferase, partial [Nonomuraea sp.]|nr:GNAT family N-acetyltransferase [Nonomuraea sp.]
MQADEFGEVMARAFHDDPVMAWLLPDGQGLALMFTALSRHIHALTDVAHRDGDMVGGAVWDPPGFEGDLEAAIPVFVEAMGDAVDRGATLDEVMAAHRPKEPHWYLAQIGVAPELGGKGVGGELMRQGL